MHNERSCFSDPSFCLHFDAFQEKADIQSMMQVANEVEAQIAKLEEIFRSEKERCRQSEFYMEARQVKVLRDLRKIYPISISKSEERYAIRDLRIPSDVHSGTIPEEELSAALGCLCHLVLLTSKYLAVQLRYRVFFNSSRSAIQEDGSMVFPLFQARMVERDQLDYAMLLIQRNVDCISKSCTIEYREQEHVLVNLKRLIQLSMDRLQLDVNNNMSNMVTGSIVFSLTTLVISPIRLPRIVVLGLVFIVSSMRAFLP